MKKIGYILAEISPLYLVVPVFIVIFFFRFAGMKEELSISEEEQKVYDIIENINNGSKVMIVSNFGPETKYELEESLSTLISYFAKKGVGIVFTTMIPVGIETSSLSVEKSIAGANFSRQRYLYGTDYVHMGYIAGGFAAPVLMTTNISNVRKKDIYGNELKNLPVMNGIENINDFSAVFEFSSQTVDGIPGMVFLSVFSNNKSVPKIVFCSSDMVAGYMPFYKIETFDGFVGGFKSIVSFTKIIDPDTSIENRYYILLMILVYVLILIAVSNAGSFLRGRK